MTHFWYCLKIGGCGGGGRWSRLSYHHCTTIMTNTTSAIHNQKLFVGCLIVRVLNSISNEVNQKVKQRSVSSCKTSNLWQRISSTKFSFMGILMNFSQVSQSWSLGNGKTDRIFFSESCTVCFEENLRQRLWANFQSNI